MGRIILILTAACLLATFMIISNSTFKPITSASPAKEEVSKKAEKDRPRKPEQSSHASATKKGAKNSSQPSSAANSKEGSVGAAAMEEEEHQDQDVAHAIVKGDYTPIYSVNSRQSSVVGLLKKGDKVATELEVLDEKGKWTIVKKGDLTRPGFVLDANLQRANTTKKTKK